MDFLDNDDKKIKKKIKKKEKSKINHPDKGQERLMFSFF